MRHAINFLNMIQSSLQVYPSQTCSYEYSAFTILSFICWYEIQGQVHHEYNSNTVFLELIFEI